MPSFATPWAIYMDFMNDLDKQDVLWSSLLTASADYANSPEGKLQLQEAVRTMVNTYAKCPPSQAHATMLAAEHSRTRGGSKSKKRRTRRKSKKRRTRSKSR